MAQEPMWDSPEQKAKVKLENQAIWLLFKWFVIAPVVLAVGVKLLVVAIKSI